MTIEDLKVINKMNLFRMSPSRETLLELGVYFSMYNSRISQSVISSVKQLRFNPFLPVAYYRLMQIQDPKIKQKVQVMMSSLNDALSDKT